MADNVVKFPGAPLGPPEKPCPAWMLHGCTTCKRCRRCDGCRCANVVSAGQHLFDEKWER